MQVPGGIEAWYRGHEKLNVSFPVKEDFFFWGEKSVQHLNLYKPRLHWLASGRYGLWVFTRTRDTHCSTSFNEGPYKLKQEGSGDVATTKALIDSKIFCRRVGVACVIFAVDKFRKPNFFSLVIDNSMKKISYTHFLLIRKL